MIRRRARYDPLAERSRPHWLVVHDMTGAVLEVDVIELGADLHALMGEVIERMTAQGWTVESDGREGSFFANRDGVRRFINLQPTDPALPQIYPSRVGRCPNCDD